MREKINRIIFGHDTHGGKLFDIILLWVIFVSVVIVIAESVPLLHTKFGDFFFYAEWTITILFTLEY
ncbi:MAG: ion transporter, partial [Pedobacter sp.]